MSSDEYEHNEITAPFSDFSIDLVQLKNSANEHFRKAVTTWKNEWPAETAGIREDEFNEEGLLLNALTKSEDGSLLHAEFIKIFSNGLRVVYILKFKNDALWDDVFYTERC